jgi:site-specific DNA recombinase
MNVVCYARRSHDQNNRSQEQQSVTRQLQLAQEFAAARGWRVIETFSDEASKGADFTRPGLVRLLAAAARTPPAFSALIVADKDRIGREQIETAYVLKQILKRGISVYEYQTGRQVQLASSIDKITLAVEAYAGDLEREKAAVRSRDALVMRARRGAAVGGRLFAYAQTRVLGADGQPAHVERSIDPTQAPTVVSMFELVAAGSGFKAIAKRLNAKRIPSPRPSQVQRSQSWTASSVRAIIFNPHYTGRIVYGRTKKRDAWGQKRQSDQPKHEWIETCREDLRIISDELWARAHARIAASRAVFKAGFSGRAHGRPPSGTESPYLLSGFLECAQCGGSLVIGSRRGMHSRSFAYVCAYHRERGDTVCANALQAPMVATDTAVLDSLHTELFHPDVLDGLVEEVMDALAPTDGGRAQRQRLAREMHQIEREIARYAEAIATAPTLESPLTALRIRETKRADLRRELDGLDAATRIRAVDRRRLEHVLRETIVNAREMLPRPDVPERRQMLRTVLQGRLIFTPHLDRQGRR